MYLLIVPNSDKDKGFVKADAAKGEVWGYNPAHRIYQGWGEPAGFNGWFFIRIEKTIVNSGTFKGGEIFAVDSIRNGKDIGAYVGFNMKFDVDNFFFFLHRKASGIPFTAKQNK